jgi:ribosomal protein L11 methyltransferase
LQTEWKALKIVMKRGLVDDLAPFFFSRGCTGVSYDEIKIGERSDLPEFPPEEMTTLSAFFPHTCNVREVASELNGYLGRLASDNPLRSIEYVEVEDFGWAEKWKEYFTPKKVGLNTVVVPTWEKYERKGEETVLHIDPGEAFGTGSHETTSLCIKLIEYAFSGDRVPLRCLDIGCGSGILAILMAKLGGRCVLALDHDEKAVTITVANSNINSVSDRLTVSHGPLSTLSSEFDLITANILAEPLVQMRDSIWDLLPVEGKVILSGILNEKEGWVRDEYLRAGFTLQDVKQDGMWSALFLEKG